MDRPREIHQTAPRRKHRHWRKCMGKFRLDCHGNRNPLKHEGKKFDLPDQDQLVDRTRIGNHQPHESELQFFESLAFLFEVLDLPCRGGQAVVKAGLYRASADRASSTCRAGADCDENTCNKTPSRSIMYVTRPGMMPSVFLTP